ncbi:MAG: tyrosine--tRNA ligase [Candidatus Limnocylindrales bacterium]
MSTVTSAARSSRRGPEGLLDELRWRGLLHDATPGLADRLASGAPISGYIGFDPSGSSLHVGHLVPVFGLLHLQRFGGRPIALVGGATGMIGDPSGTSAERNLLDRDTIAANVAGIRGQLERFLDFSAGPSGASIVNNLDWLGEVRMLDFLRDVGKHFTIPYMLDKESVRTRLDGGLSFTEFSYMLLQAADFRHLNRSLGVELQMGGADQWGNITAGLELIRRTVGGADGSGPRGEEAGVPGSAPAAFALSYPLLLDSSGRKFGKTAAGTAVWLDPARTSPYAFYQFFVDTPDAEVPGLVRRFTVLGRAEVDALEAEQAAHPERRPAQRALALELTTRVHGLSEAERAVAVSRAAFDSAPIRDPAVLAAMYDVLDHGEVAAEDLSGGVIRLAVTAGLVASNGEARRSIAQGGLSINGIRIATPDDPIPEPIAGRWLVLRVGRKRIVVVRVLGGAARR